MKKIIFSVILAAGFQAAGFAGDFDLNSLGVSDLKAAAQAADMNVPVPQAVAGLTKAPNLPAPALDMTIKLPFKEINKRMVGLCDDMKVLDESVPVISRQGDHLVFTNVSINYRGIECFPVVLLKPVFDGNNRLSIKILKVDVDMAFGPAKSFSTESMNKDQVMAYMAEALTDSMMASIDESFLANKVPLKAKDVLAFSYDKAAWNLRAAITPGFVAPLLPGLINNISLTAFSFDDAGFALSVKSGSASAIAQLPGYNLAMSDGLLDNFIAQYTKGTDFDLHPAGHEAGLKFRADGRLEVAGKIYARDVFLKPNVYFKATMLPELIGPNKIKLRIDRVDVDQAYGVGLPGFINNWIQGTVTASVITTITTDPALGKVMTARKLDDKTVEITLKNSAFLPSFAKGAVIRNLKIGNGLMYLGFDL
jgi:hypothetical protein